MVSPVHSSLALAPATPTLHISPACPENTCFLVLYLSVLISGGLAQPSHLVSHQLIV
jgi:hypothetical protein